MRIGINATTQDQSQERHGEIETSQRVIAIHPVSLYYAGEKIVN
jgi:hypothetical protein